MDKTDPDYDALGRVKQVEDAEMLQVGDRGPYTFYIADGTRGERDDPLGDAWSVTYDTYGHPARYIDERGYETDAITDGRGRVTLAEIERDSEMHHEIHREKSDLGLCVGANGCFSPLSRR